MKYSVTAVSLGIVALTMTACSFSSLRSSFSSGEQASSFSSSMLNVDLTSVTYEGLLERPSDGSDQVSPFRLSLGDNRYLYLQSDIVDIPSYVGERVTVSGIVRPALDDTAKMMIVSSISLSGTEASSEAPMVVDVSIQDQQSSAPPASSSQRSVEPPVKEVLPPTPLPPPPPVAPKASSSSSVSLEVGTDAQLDPAKINAMAKAGVSPSLWTLQYCTGHIGFCVPVHKNWWFKSFGATTATLWHVEVSSVDFENIGEGPLAVDFVSGSLPSSVTDGMVVEKDGKVIGYRSWTGQRHFEISAPVQLKAVVEYMTQGLSTYEAPPAP
jgi:hypothetical protein